MTQKRNFYPTLEAFSKQIESIGIKTSQCDLWIQMEFNGVRGWGGQFYEPEGKQVESVVGVKEA